MQWILRVRVYVIIFLAVLLILSAVTFSMLRAILPYATGYKNEIQREVSEQIGLPVEIESIDAAIHWFSPRLKLIDVTIHDKDKTAALFVFKEAFVQLDVIASILHREFIVDDIGMVGADISIIKISENEWLVQGVKVSGVGADEIPEALLYMLQNSDYLLHDSRIIYQDRTEGEFSLALNNVNIDVNNDFNNHDLKISMSLPSAYGQDLAIVSNLTGDLKTLSGDVYLEVKQVNVKQWNQKFNLLSEYHVDTILDVNLWLSLDNGNVKEIISQLSASDFYVNNNETSKGWKTNFLSVNIRYTAENGYSSIAASDFYFGNRLTPDWPAKANIIAREDEKDYFLSADFLNLADLQKITQVFLDEESIAAFEKIQEYKLQADVYNLNLKFPKDIIGQKTAKQKVAYLDVVNQEAIDTETVGSVVADPVVDQVVAELIVSDQAQVNHISLEHELWGTLDLQATVNDLSIYDSKNKIQLTGLDTSLRINEGVATLDLVSQNTIVDIPSLFRNPLHANTLQGKLSVNREDSGWHISSNSLQLKNEHIDTYSRLDIQISSVDDVFLDVQTDFFDAYGKYATHYLPVGVLSDELVAWLDMAVTDGYIPAGQFILHGDVQHFPFDKHEGVFQVLLSANNANVRFLKDWPLVKDTSATIKFNNKSLQITNASAKTQSINLFNGDIEIKNLLKPHLTVKTDGQAMNEDVQAYIWGSPLDDVLGNSMRLFQFSGSSKLNLTIDVPLSSKKTVVAIDGHLEFINTSIYYPVLGYEIKALNGDIDFTKDSISADAMTAEIQGEKVLLSAVTREGESGSEVVFHLDGKLQTDYLLQHYDWIPDDWFSGKSHWSLDLEVPYQPKDYLVHLNAKSNLEGVGVQLSDKVHKLSTDKINFNTAIDVLENNGLRVDTTVSLDAIAALGAKKVDKNSDNKAGHLFSLYATRSAGNLWNFNVDSAYLIGRGEFTEGLDKDTTVKLDLERIDLYTLLYSEEEKYSESLSPDTFPQLNFQIKRLRWDEWLLRNVVLETDWHKHGMLINKFSVKGPSMSFDARGTWLKSWRNTQETVLQGTMTSSNFGDTLTGLGFNRSINHGTVTATFDAKWPTAPYILSWSKMKGKSLFEMKKGEILEVEPGASGRLLGLLNIFELTNRLAFDFDDITHKGFSFDYITGEFEFSSGDGALKNFIVSAAAADVNMFGSIGLLKRDYGLLMHVKPHTDTLTFAGGALLGGVAVGAGLALIQKVFDLGVLGHTVYSITGGWDDPEIERIVQKTLDEEEEF